MTTKQKAQIYQDIEHKFLDMFYDYPETTGYEIRTILNKLHRYEATLSRINENDCNGHPRTKIEYRDGKKYEYAIEDIAWKERDAKKEISIQKKVRALLEPLGIVVKFNGDPRGGSIRMLLPDNTSNGWDGETWGIYW